VREVRTAPAYAHVHACDTHLKVRASITTVFIYVATCVTFMAAHTVRAIMLGRRKRHGGTISLSTGVARAWRIQEIGLSLKCILTHVRKITVGHAYRPFTLYVILLKEEVCLERYVHTRTQMRMRKSSVDKSFKCYELPPN